MKNFRLLLFLNLLSFNLLAQPNYLLHWPQEAGWAGGSGLVVGVSQLLKPHTPGFTPEQVAALDASRIPRFDRYALHHYSLSAQHSSDVVLISSIALPLVLLADRNIRRDAPEVAVVVGEVFLVNLALTSLTKELVHRPRPFNYNPEAPLADKLQSDARRSFFSGHTSTTAAMTFATAKIWTDYHQNSNWKPVVWVAAAAIPATVGYLRMRGGKHFLSDVAVGMVVGAASGILVPHWHRSH
ncbi:MAG: phosphatase PAP2 family protein [Saprospiraceae bacterium]